MIRRWHILFCHDLPSVYVYNNHNTYLHNNKNHNVCVDFIMCHYYWRKISILMATNQLGTEHIICRMQKLGKRREKNRINPFFLCFFLVIIELYAASDKENRRYWCGVAYAVIPYIYINNCFSSLTPPVNMLTCQTIGKKKTEEKIFSVYESINGLKVRQN